MSQQIRRKQVDLKFVILSILLVAAIVIDIVIDVITHQSRTPLAHFVVFVLLPEYGLRYEEGVATKIGLEDGSQPA